ncbi:MAG: alpha/beta hydrolase [Pseudohongiellaceae bacterium]
MRRVLTTLILSVCAFEASAQEGDFDFHSELAEQWHGAGDYFDWVSTTPNNDGATVRVHYRRFGDPEDPRLILLHGYPTSSFDFREMIVHLQDDYHIATLDFPGFGFSDKPTSDYSYLLEDDARLVDHFVREIVHFDDFALITHDRGVSVGLAFLGHYLDNPDPGYRVNYHVLSNSGMFLPLANLTEGQTVLLDEEAGRRMTAARRAEPRLTEGDPVAVAYADIQAFNDGIGARRLVGRYLLERVDNEYRWLDNLPRSPVPVAYIWGALDPVNPLRIANHVWDAYLNDRPVESSFWVLPTAGHYPQRDRPAEMAKVIDLALSGEVPSLEDEDDFMWQWNRSRTEHDAVFIGHSHIEAMDFGGSIRYTPDGYVPQD